MHSKSVWRNLAILLVVGNLSFWAWTQGYLRELGMGPKSVQEPQRLKDQVEPQGLTIRNASSQEAASAAVQESN
jgi:hypothetical protein